MDPQRFDIHLRGVAAQCVHSQRCFQVPEIEFNLPTLTIECFEGAFGHLTRQCSHENLAAGSALSNSQLLRCLSVRLCAHPVGFFLWLMQCYPMIPGADAMATTKIG